MILHLADAAREGFHRILLRMVDTDVVVLAVAAAAKLNLQELWVAFGTGKHFRYIPFHEIALSLGPQKSQALPIFHAYTGCDTVSSFSTRSKKSAWETWKVFDEVTATFLALSTGPVEVNDDTLERFTILLYGHTSSMVNIDEARQELFTDPWMLSSQPKLPLSSTSKGLCIKEDIAGARCCKHPCVCHLLRTGDGLTHSNGSHCGWSCQKLALLPGS